MSTGAAQAAARAAAQAANKAAGKSARNTSTYQILGAVGAATLVMPQFWINLASMSNMMSDDASIDHGQANKTQEALRSARRGSLKEFKEAYYGKADEHDYQPGAYWDRFNNNTITEQKYNPNKKSPDVALADFKKKRSVGLYDTNGVVDASRSHGNAWQEVREGGMKLAHKV